MRVPFRTPKLLGGRNRTAKALLRATLAALPTEIIYDICDYLATSDRSNLRLASKAVLAKVPPPQRSSLAVHCNKIDAVYVEKLASMPLSQRRQFEHLALDFTPTSLAMMPKSVFDLVVQRYPDDLHRRILNFCQSYEGRNPGFMDEVPETRAFPGADVATSPPTEEPDPVVGNTYKFPFRKPMREPQRGEKDKLSSEAISRLTFQLYVIVYHSSLGALGEEPFYRSREPVSKPDLFKYTAQIFKLLPNVRTLEFRTDGTSLTAQPAREYLTEALEKTNPLLTPFLAENPELENLPWQSWFQFYAHDEDNSLHAVYPGIIIAAVSAEAQICQIRWNDKIWYNSGRQLPVWMFARFETPFNRGSSDVPECRSVKDFDYLYGDTPESTIKQRVNELMLRRL
ncbi:hypothetical protein TWF281_004856 [Arthrobotrys megalospora]